MKSYLISILVFLIVIAAISCGAASWPTIQAYPQVSTSTSTLIANDSTYYSVSTTIADNDGYNDIADVRILFDFMESGNDQSKGRGYMAWATTDASITYYGGTWSLGNATGGGRWGYTTDLWGGIAYITPLSCSISSSGTASGGAGSRTVTWTFKAKPAWAMNPVINDIAIRAVDAEGNTIGWRDNPNEFYVVSYTRFYYCATPSAPLIAGTTETTVDVAISPNDSSTDVFCIRVSPAVLGKDFVQADGTLAAWPLFQTKSAWGTVTVSGLASNTSYDFKLQAARLSLGYWPSAWSSVSTVSTGIVTHAIDYTNAGISINKGIMGNETLPFVQSARLEADTIAACYNTSMRWGGDGYDWKTLTAQSSSSNITTLQRLRQARDRNSYLQNLTDTRGIGTGNGSTWVYTDQTPETLAALTADWVFYCNKLVQTKRQGDLLDTREQAVLDSMQWGTVDKLLQPGEAAVPKVEYWEIGNEPEGPYPPPSLTPADYANRYNIISHAVLAEDPTIKIGPGCMTADNGNAWLDAVFSNPDNRIDLVAYHPYGPLYGITKTTSGGVLNADDLSKSLNTIRQSQIDKRQKIVDRLVANGRPANTELLISEWNPSSWEGTYYFDLSRTVAHALGLADSIFTFAGMGITAAQYWDRPNCPSTTAIEAPGFKVFKVLQTYMGDRLIDTYTEPNFRLYTTLDTRTGRLVLWAINYSEYADKTMRFQLSDVEPGMSIIQHRLAAVSGDTSLITKNGVKDSSEKVNWAITDITNSVNPADFDLVFPKATLTMIRVERPFLSLPDNTQVTLGKGWDVQGTPGVSVTAVHPDESYLYIEQDDRTWGMRVNGDCSGISVGDRVAVTGIINTYRPDGVISSERCINASSIDHASSGSYISPLGMTCRSVGGGPKRGTVGVKNSCGPSNIGLLVRTVGRVMSIVDGEYMYIDDGSQIADTGDNVGVLVKCPSTESYQEKDIVAVTGVVESSIPEGWSLNRRFIRAPTSDDITLLAREQ